MKMIAGPHGCANPASAIAPRAPMPSNASPHQIMRSMPSRIDSREVRKFPAM